MPEEELSPCTECKGTGELNVGPFETIKCWYCKGTGTKLDIKAQADKLRKQLDDAAATATERDRIKTTADKLSFAIRHSCDGVCL